MQAETPLFVAECYLTGGKIRFLKTKFDPNNIGIKTSKKKKNFGSSHKRTEYELPNMMSFIFA